MAVSLVLPCYNPPHGWEQNVNSAYYAFCERINEKVEIIIVIDGAAGSEVDNGTTFLEHNIPHISIAKYHENKGKGYALRQGVAAATGDIIIYTDIDFPYTADSLFAIYDGLAKNEYDVGIGVKDEQYYVHVPFLRK